MHGLRSFLSFLVGVALLLSVARSDVFVSAQELSPNEAKSIAKEAYVYGFPMVENYKTMVTYAVAKGGPQYKAPLNTLKNEANVFTPADTTVVTPNSDTPYSFLWMDLRAEPLVLGVPKMEDGRYYSIQLVDLYTFNFDYIGSRTTGHGAGHYMIAGPAWKGAKPDGVTKVIGCETEFALAIYRTQLLGPDDLAQVQALQRQYTVQTLSDYTGDAAPAPAEPIDFPPFESGSVEDVSVFRYLTFLLQFCPVHPSESELMARLARTDIVPGEVFDGSKRGPEIEKALRNGIAEANAAIEAGVPTANSAEIFGTRDFLKNDYLKRAVAARVGLYGNSKEEALYPLYLTDAEGRPLDGSKGNYVLRISEGGMPPVNAFWSVTMYDGQTQTLVSNPINRYLINSPMLDGLKRDPDGGLTLTVQYESPGTDNQANWLPAPPRALLHGDASLWAETDGRGRYLDGAVGVARGRGPAAAGNKTCRCGRSPRGQTVRADRRAET